MTTEYKNMGLADSVLHRIVQIVQEGFLMGIDVSDLLRQIRLQADSQDATSLVLTPEYAKSVEEMHTKALSELDKKKAEAETVPTAFKVIPKVD